MKNFILIFVSLSILVFAPFAQSVEDVYGLMSVVKGDVKVVSAKDKSTGKARVGQKVFPGDTVITGPDSRAKVTMVDKNIINISPDSKLVVEKYEFKPDENKKNVTLNVVYGKVRSAVEQKYDGEQNKFHVKTPSAVAGVRGTDFLVSFDRASAGSKIVTFSGQVEVGKGLDAMGKIAEPVRVNPGQFTTASPSAPPAPPAPMPASELNNLKRESAAEPAQSGNASNDSKPDAKKDPAKSAGNGDGKDKGGDSKDKQADKGAEPKDKPSEKGGDQKGNAGGEASGDKKPSGPGGGGASASGGGDGSSGGGSNGNGGTRGGSPREPASIGSGGTASPGGSTLPGSMAPTVGDMTNTGPSFAGTVPKLPDPIGLAPLPPPLPIQQLPPTINQDIIRSGNTRLNINIK